MWRWPIEQQVSILVSYYCMHKKIKKPNKNQKTSRKATKQNKNQKTSRWKRPQNKTKNCVVIVVVVVKYMWGNNVRTPPRGVPWKHSQEWLRFEHKLMDSPKRRLGRENSGTHRIPLFVMEMEEFHSPMELDHSTQQRLPFEARCTNLEFGVVDKSPGRNEQGERN